MASDAGCCRLVFTFLCLALFGQAGAASADVSTIFSCYAKTEPFPVYRVTSRRYDWEPAFDCSPLLGRRGALLPLSMDLLDPLYEKIRARARTRRSAVRLALRVRLRKAQQDAQLMKEITILRRRNQTSHASAESRLRVYEHQVYSRLQWRHDELKTIVTNISADLLPSVVTKLNRVGRVASERVSRKHCLR
ncbi:hypothetical protein NP493_844g00005 [Ridgeia piscesae]|uniref:Uncharacterized protein n=1 Tax=Ridgeia piscesae TaxID=27915 RepID=A0AAD9NKR1_RIDPI|nr:hypothetical protein NP493_844g00005 [Ridgeia piscesae]